MKIGFVRRGYSSTGGAEAYLLRLAQSVFSKGHQPILITSKEWPEARWPNELIVRAGGSSPMRFAKELERLSNGCDILFSFERIRDCEIYRAGDGVHAAWLKRRTVIDPLWKQWTRWINRKHRELLCLERRMYSPQHTRWVIANSRMVRDEIVAHYGYPEERIEIIPNGYDGLLPNPELREMRRAELGIGSDNFVALFAGSGWKRKGLCTAVTAIKRLPQVSLIVAGRGDSTPYRNISNLRFVGARSDLQADFAAADIFVLPTIYDPFSNACLEALAAGLPVVTTTANGFSEIIVDQIQGSIIAPNDVAALAEAVRFWSLDNRVRVASPKCRKTAAIYSVEANTQRTLDVIMRAMRQ